MLELNISPEALRDLQRIRRQDAPGPNAAPGPRSEASAQRQVKRLLGAMRRLREDPGGGPRVSTVISVVYEYHFLSCGDYLILYRYDDDQLFILRVLYSAPEYAGVLFRDGAQADFNA